MTNKLKLLTYNIEKLESVLICYSGGADSSLLLKLSVQALGAHAQAVFFDSVIIPERDKAGAVDVAAEIGAQLHIRHVDTLNVPGLADNPENRCYICKHNILSQARAFAAELGINHVAEGSHADDLTQHRPGRQAIQELGILSPFADAGMGKADIRAISKSLCLSTWDKPSYSCLMTRLPHNETVEIRNLKKVEKAEDFLRSLGFIDFRVRHKSATTALLEIIPEESSLLISNNHKIKKFITYCGYDLLETSFRKG